MPIACARSRPRVTRKIAKSLSPCAVDRLVRGNQMEASPLYLPLQKSPSTTEHLCQHANWNRACRCGHCPLVFQAHDTQRIYLLGLEQSSLGTLPAWVRVAFPTRLLNYPRTSYRLRLKPRTSIDFGQWILVAQVIAIRFELCLRHPLHHLRAMA